ncbi:hypothetical protein [Desulfobulbus oralis]|uniref:Uncharacterized protein n=1 Tax=Desulfobulbus oralis TaxID=1986146 RepID=A0A2L1GPX3_9BACT|nr:hypothetical protein [Desulfobulbus oralis]AVD71730.1 hypothetical protein CAY53_09845 [Desulfobulbus oralis]
MQKLLALFCVLASLLPAAPALAAVPDAEFLKLCEQGSPAAVAQARRTAPIRTPRMYPAIRLWPMR